MEPRIELAPPLGNFRRIALLISTLMVLVACGTRVEAPATQAGNSAVTEGATNHVAIDLGRRHACVIRSNGSVHCWGDDTFRQSSPAAAAGDGGVRAPVVSLASAPAIVDPTTGNPLIAVEVSCGDDFSCAREADGDVWCWGKNANGVVDPDGTLGAATGVVRVPIQVYSALDGSGGVAGSLQTVAAKGIAAGDRHLCMLLVDGRVACRGDNTQGQYGVLPAPPSGYPHVVVRGSPGTGDISLRDFVRIVSGSEFSCGLKSNGQILCWGRWYSATPGVITPLLVGPTTDAYRYIDLAAGAEHACAITQEHYVTCWGRNNLGQRGVGSSEWNGAAAYAYSTVDPAVGVVTLAAGVNHTCIVTLQDRTFCWGDDTDGQLGRGTGDSGTAVQYNASSPLTRVVAISAGENFTCVSAYSGSSYNDGAVKCWGRGASGQLANGTTTGASSPALAYTPDVLVSCTGGGSMNVWTSPHHGPMIASGMQHTCAYVEDSRCVGGFMQYRRGVACWGSNQYGQLSTASSASYSAAPVFVQETDVLSIAAGTYHTCVVTLRGELYCWGDNIHGQVGVSSASSPIGTPTRKFTGGVVQVVAGTDFTCALFANGLVSCWGNNAYGTLGRAQPVGCANTTWDPSSTHAASPVIVGDTPTCFTENLSGVTQLSAGSHSVCARLATGRIRCWGRNPTVNHLNNVEPSRCYAGDASDRIYGCTGDPRFCGAAMCGLMSTNYAMEHAGPSLGGDGFAVSVSTHEDGACAILPNGALQCMGTGALGILGTGFTTARTGFGNVVGFDGATPTQRVIAISGAGSTKCAVAASGRVRCWGWNGVANAGASPSTSVVTPNEVLEETAPAVTAPIDGAIGITAGGFQSCAFMADGRLRCWGSNQYGNLGVGLGLTSSQYAQSVSF